MSVARSRVNAIFPTLDTSSRKDFAQRTEAFERAAVWLFVVLSHHFKALLLCQVDRTWQPLRVVKQLAA